MNKIVIFTISSLIPTCSCLAQWSDNCFIEITPLDAICNANELYINSGSDARMKITEDFYDNFGYKESTYQIGCTPNRATLVSEYLYDGLARHISTFLPVPINDPEDVPSYIERAEFYGDDINYDEIFYENSMLNRVVGFQKSGSAYQGHTSQVEYGSNQPDDVMMYKAIHNGASTIKLYNHGYYGAGDLYMVDISDEDGKRKSTYTNKSGQIVLTRQYDGNDILSTYYVYDEFGRLCYVLPPIAADNATTIGLISDEADYMKGYTYIYKYDDMGNCVEKRLPGCESVYMEYDNANRMISLEDGNMRAKNIKEIFEYDKFSRIKRICIKDANMQIRPLIVNYYDTYTFIDSLASTEIQEVSYHQMDGYDSAYSSAVGKLTGQRIYALYGPGTYYEARSYYYDSYGRVVQEHLSKVVGGGFEHSYYSYSFAGQILKKKIVHTNQYEISPIIETYTNTYDHADRLITTKYKLADNSEITLVRNTYDELGRLSRRISCNANVGNKVYSYNIHNQITEISGKTRKLYYYTNPISDNGVPSYNGSISESQTYMSRTLKEDNVYRYDGLNRLISSNASDGSDKYRTSWEYDKMSNVTSLARYDYNGNIIDDLSISYFGNQITTIDDDAGSQSRYGLTEYQDYSTDLLDFTNELLGWSPSLITDTIPNEHQYDANGNMTVDLDRKIVAVRYNLLNLPDTVQFVNGSQIVNQYLADGTKVRSEFRTLSLDAIVPIGTICPTDHTPGLVATKKLYCSNLEYDVSRNNVVTLSKIYNSEGYYNGYDSTSRAFACERDAQGSITATFNATSLSQISSAYYYADGLKNGSSANLGTLPRLFLGKEFVTLHGYDGYDMGARYSYSVLGRYETMDPLSEKYYNTSPYAYCAGDPVNRVDYNGLDWYSTTNEDGSVSGKWFDSNATIIDDNGVMYNHVGKTMNGFDADGNFIYGAQDGQTYTSAPLQEVEVHGNAEVAMARSIHKAQNAFLTSPQMKITALSMGALMWGPQALEASAPYIASAARYTYSATSNAAIATYNAGKYYGTSALINGIKGLGKAKTLAEMFMINGSGSVVKDMLLGGLYGRFLYDLSPDTPEISINPVFDVSNKMSQFVMYCIKLISDQK